MDPSGLNQMHTKQYPLVEPSSSTIADQPKKINPQDQPLPDSPAISLTTSPSDLLKATRSSKEKGYYHLGRKEFSLAIEWYSQALQVTEKQQDMRHIADALKDLGRTFLEQGEWVKAAKIFNSAFALLPEQDERARQIVLAFMEEVEQRLLEKECQVKVTKIPKGCYLTRRKILQAPREAVTMNLKSTFNKSLRNSL